MNLSRINAFKFMISGIALVASIYMLPFCHSYAAEPEFGIEPQFNICKTVFQNDAAVVTDESGQDILINRAGEVIIYSPPDGEQSIAFRGNGLIQVLRDGRIAFYNKFGGQLTEYIYSLPQPKFTFDSYYGEGDGTSKLIPFYRDGKFGYMDDKAVEVIPPKFDYARAFYEGLACVAMGGYISTGGLYYGNNLGYIDETGDLIIPTDYWSADDFLDGYAVVNGNQKVLDKTGKAHTNYGYKWIAPIGNGFFKVGNSDAGYGVVNESGKVIVPVYFESVDRYMDLFIAGRTEIFDINGKLIRSMKNTSIHQHFEPNRYLSYSTSAPGYSSAAYGLIDENGDIVLEAKDYAALYDKGEGLIYATTLKGERYLLDYNMNRILGINLSISLKFTEGLLGFFDINTAKYGYLKNPLPDYDMQCSDWARSSVEKAKKLGILPNSLDIYDYRNRITRFQFCDLVYNCLKDELQLNAEGESPFTDISRDSVTALNSAGIISGKSDTLFAPYDYLTREEAANILHRIVRRSNREIPQISEKFSDDSDISDWAKDGVYAMYAIGIMQGMDENAFSPKSTLSVEQAITTVIRFMEL